MKYVELHRVGDSWQIRFDPKGDHEEPLVSGDFLVLPILVQLGVQKIGPWDIVTGDDGVQFQRARIIELTESDF